MEMQEIPEEGERRQEDEAAKKPMLEVKTEDLNLIMFNSCAITPVVLFKSQI